MDKTRKYKKVFYEFWTKEGYQGRMIHGKRHMRFSEADIPDLFDNRPYKDQEKIKPDYLYRVDHDGIHIAIFYDGLSEQPEWGIKTQQFTTFR